MFYETMKEYLVDQVRNPIKKALEKGDKKEVMEIVDFELEKHLELNALSKGFEDFAIERGVKFDIPIMEFIQKYASKYMCNPNFEK